MILHALHIVRAHLSAYLESVNPSTDEQVVLANIAFQDESRYVPGASGSVRDTIVCTLTRIEEESSLKNRPVVTHNDLTGRYETENPPVPLNLHLLFAVNSNRYDNALTHLSRIIAFFQSRSVFTQHDAVSLGDLLIPAEQQLEEYKLQLELISPSFEQLNQIWSTLGSRQLPSVHYRMRMLDLQLRQPVDAGPPIQEIHLYT